MKRRLAGTLLFLFVVLLAVSCWNKKPSEEESESKYLNHKKDAFYVGREACKGCHSDIYATFMHTGMGQSWGAATKEKSAGKFTSDVAVYDAYRNLYYHPQWKKDTLQIMEFRLEGKDTIFKRTENIQYIVGSGQHTNSHIYQVNGFLYQAPLTFYTQKGEWNLPPGFENGHNSRFGRAIELECVSCHNAFPAMDESGFNTYSYIPLGITCERCHGPGSKHVEEKKNGFIIDTKKEIDYSIVNPSKLPWKLQIDLCERCHLQGNAVLKPGKSFFDFKPGMVLNKFMDIYMPKFSGNDTRIIMASHAERFQKSQCFLKSNELNDLNSGGLKFTCISCHNPHVSVKSTDKEVFNTVCRNCHQSKTCTAPKAELKKAADNCVQCHMPKNGAIDIPHVTVHDHFIRVPKDAQAPDELRKFMGIVCINNPDPGDESRAEAYLNYFEKFDASEKMTMDSAFYYINRCKGREDLWLRYYYLKGMYKEAISFGKRINVNSATDAWICYRMGECYMKDNSPDLAEKWIDKAVVLKPKSPDFLFKKGYLLYSLNRTGEAKKVFEEILLLNPNYAEAWSSLALIICNKGQGDIDKAIEYNKRALSLDPDLKSALVNLLDIYNARGNETELKKTIYHLYKIAPKDTRLLEFYRHYNLTVKP